MRDYPALQKDHALAAWRLRTAALFVPALPILILRQARKLHARPLTHIDLIECRHHLDCESASCGDDTGRLKRPALRAGLQCCWLELTYQVCNNRHLPTPQFIKLDPGHSTAEHAVQQRMMTMTYKVDMRSHAAALTRHRR
jgi:hypothetical protein